MEPLIPDGSYCIFRRTPEGARNGAVVLVERHDSPDPETGWRFTVKRYRSDRARAEIVLEPVNLEFERIVIREGGDATLRVIGELVEVLKPDARAEPA